MEGKVCEQESIIEIFNDYYKDWLQTKNPTTFRDSLRFYVRKSSVLHIADLVHMVWDKSNDPRANALFVEIEKVNADL